MDRPDSDRGEPVSRNGRTVSVVRGMWVNGVNIALSPSFPTDGRCPTCGEPFHNIETSVRAAPRLRPTAEKITPPKIKGPYFTPCGHDAASVFGGRVDG